MSRATRPPIISLVVWSALIPVLPFMFASWLIDGPQLMLASLRQIDMLTVLSLLYLAFIATLVGYGIWGSLLGRYETWRIGAAVAAGAGSGDGQRCAAAGDAERTAARRGGADHGRALYQRFRSASGAAAWRAGKKAPETGLYTSMRVMASQVVLLVVRHAKFVRFIIAGRHMIEIKRRVVMFRREHCVTLVCRTGVVVCSA